MGHLLCESQSVHIETGRWSGSEISSSLLLFKRFIKVILYSTHKTNRNALLLWCPAGVMINYELHLGCDKSAGQRSGDSQVPGRRM